MSSRAQPDSFAASFILTLVAKRAIRFLGFLFRFFVTADDAPRQVIEHLGGFHNDGEKDETGKAST